MQRSAGDSGFEGVFSSGVVRIRGQEKERKREKMKKRSEDVRVCVFSLCHSLCAKSRSNERGGENFGAKRPFLPTTAAEAARTILGVRPLQGPPRNAPKAIVTRGVVLVIDGAAPVENALARRSLPRRGSSCQPQPVNLASDGAFSPLPFLSARVFSWRPKKCAPYDRRHVGPFAVSLSWQQPTDSSLTPDFPFPRSCPEGTPVSLRPHVSESPPLLAGSEPASLLVWLAHSPKMKSPGATVVAPSLFLFGFIPLLALRHHSKNSKRRGHSCLAEIVRNREPSFLCRAHAHRHLGVDPSFSHHKTSVRRCIREERKRAGASASSVKLQTMRSLILPPSRPFPLTLLPFFPQVRQPRCAVNTSYPARNHVAASLPSPRREGEKKRYGCHLELEAS